MSWKDLKRIMKAIIVLFICIMLGVMAAEKQINNLTEYHDFVQACNIQGNINQTYSLYFLGYRYTLPYTDELAKLPDKGYEFASNVDIWLMSARQRCVKEAYQVKKWLEGQCQKILFEIENY